MQQITVEIASDGSTKIKVDCVQGTACADLTAALEKALGKTVQDTKTKEYYERANQNLNVGRRS